MLHLGWHVLIATCFFQSATDRIDQRYLNRLVKDRICEHGESYLTELADVLLPDGVGKTQIGIIIQDRPNDVKYCFTKFFNEWSAREEATWQKLISALKYTNKHNLARDIEQMLRLPNDQSQPQDEPVQGNAIGL